MKESSFLDDKGMCFKESYGAADNTELVTEQVVHLQDDGGKEKCLKLNVPASHNDFFTAELITQPTVVSIS